MYPIQKRNSIVLTGLACVLFAVALPNELLHYGNPIIGLFCISPFFVAIYSTRSFRFASVLGMVYGGVSTLLTNYWLLFFQDFSIWTLGGVVFGYVCFGALLAPILVGVSRLDSRMRPFLIAIAWTVYEYFKSSGFLGFPWGLVAYPAHSVLPLIQFVSITGVWGLSFLMALTNAVVAEALFAYLDEHPSSGRGRISFALGRIKAPILATLMLFVFAFAYGARAVRLDRAVAKTVDMVLVQHNQNPWQSGDVVGSVRELQRLSAEGIAKETSLPDLIVWSETALRFPYEERYFQAIPPDYPLMQFLEENGVPLLTGAPYVLSVDPLEAMNASLLISPNATIVDHYGKQHPVPFAESIPFWEISVVQKFFREVIGLHAVWTKGSRYTIYEIPLAKGGALRFGTPICFEDAFPYLGRKFILHGAEMLINLTNDSWSNTISAETQHLVAAKFRAIENRRVLVRATNGGVTAVFDPVGKTLGDPLPVFTQAVMRAEIPVYTENGLSPYTRYGDYLPQAFILILGVLLTGNAARIFRSSREAGIDFRR